MDDATIGIRDDFDHVATDLVDLERYVQMVRMKMRATERLEFALDETEGLTQRTLREQVVLLAPEQADQLGPRQLSRGGEHHIAEKRLRLSAEADLASVDGC